MAQKQYLKTEKSLPDTKTFNSDKLKKILIFASGNGSNFEAIVKHFNSKDFISRHKLNPAFNIQIELITDKKDAPVIQRAKNLNIPYFYISFKDLYDFLKSRKDEYDLYILAGYMRILPEKILKILAPEKIINIHPSLLPDFKGKNAIQQAYNAGVEKTGVTIHFVEKKVDSGKIIVQKSLKIEGKSLEELENSRDLPSIFKDF